MMKSIFKETTIGGVSITKKDEALIMLFCGSPGSGKPQALNEVVQAVLKHKERAIIFDESGDFFAKQATDRDLISNLISDPSVKARLDILKVAGVKYEIIKIKPSKTAKEKS